MNVGFRSLPQQADCSQEASNRPYSLYQLASWLRSQHIRLSQLYRSKYDYVPARDSPNENHSSELRLRAGDYLIVHGSPDEDGFFEAELLTGEHGFVPSNYVESVKDLAAHPAFEVADGHPTTCNSPMAVSGVGNGSAAPFWSPTLPSSSLQKMSTANNPHGCQPILKPSNFSVPGNKRVDQGFIHAEACPYPPVDVSSITVHEPHSDVSKVPFPRDLVIERKLKRSVLLSWSHPDTSVVPISQYHVCVDGALRQVIANPQQTKTLLEDIDVSTNVHRISVRCVSEQGHSEDAACTITVGKNSPVAPQDVRADTITPVSAHISWYPSNSTCAHILLLNGTKVASCPPGIYQVVLKGLQTMTVYRCAIKIKSPKAVLEDKSIEGFVDFKTLPKIGLPDPPANVQCEPGPQPGSLLVTWNPVTSQPKPPSRAAIAGYVIFADGRKIREIDSPGEDHITLVDSDFAPDDSPLFITVRSRTREGAISMDSNVVRVPRNQSASLVTTSSFQQNQMNDYPKIPRSLPPAAIGNKPQPTAVSNEHNAQVQKYSVPVIPDSGQASQYSTLTRAPPRADQILIPNPAAVVPTDEYFIFHPNQLALPGPDLYNKDYSHQLVNLNEQTSIADMENSYIRRQHIPGASGTVLPSGQLVTLPDGTMYGKPAILPVDNRYPIVVGRGPRTYTTLQDRREKMRLRSYSAEDNADMFVPPITVPRVRVRGPVSADRAFTGNSLFGTYRRRNFPPNYPANAVPVDQQQYTTYPYRDGSNSRARSEPDLRYNDRYDDGSYGGRKMVAICSYDPYTMSVHRQYAADELAFEEGSVFNIVSESEIEGYCVAELNGRVGYVPYNCLRNMLPHEDAQYRSMTARRPGGRYGMAGGTGAPLSYGGGYNQANLFNKKVYSPRSAHDTHTLRSRTAAVRRARMQQKSYSLDQPHGRDYGLEDDEYASSHCSDPVYGGTRGRDGYPHDPYGGHSYGRQGVPKMQQGARYRHVNMGPGYGQGHVGPGHDYVGYEETHHGVRYDIPPDACDTGSDPDYYGGFDRSASCDRLQHRIKPDRSRDRGQPVYGNKDRSQDRVRRNLPRHRGSFRKEGREKFSQMLFDAPARRMIAMYDYDPHESSPNIDADLELNFQSGDIITVYGEVDEDGFFVGRLGTKTGLVPSNFLTEITDEPRHAGNSVEEPYAAYRKELPSITQVASALPPPPVDRQQQQQQQQQQDIVQDSYDDGVHIQSNNLRSFDSQDKSPMMKPGQQNRQAPEPSKAPGSALKQQTRPKTGQGTSKDGQNKPRKPQDGKSPSAAQQRKISTPGKTISQMKQQMSQDSGAFSKVLKKIVE